MTMEEKVSRPDGSFFIPDFVEIQKKVFPICRGRHYKEFQRMGPIRAGAGEVKFISSNLFRSHPPDCSIRKAILQGKRMSRSSMCRATMVSKGG
jgi:hypothetical protein